MSRRSANRVNRMLDEWVPPRLRDAALFAAVARRLYGELPVPIDEFKERAMEMSRLELASFYRSLQSQVDLGETDLTAGSRDAVLDSVVGNTVLDVACGRGHLLERLAARGRLAVGCDVAVGSGDRSLRSDRVRVVEGLVEELPFGDDTFDTAVSTHTIEHVRDVAAAMSELRRVARRRVVVVVPRQRPQLVTFNPHLQFFPYRFSLLTAVGTEGLVRCDVVDDDWLYVQDLPAA